MCGGSGGGGGGRSGRGGGGGPSPENALSGADVAKYASMGIMETTGSVDISKPVTITISGKTYDHRDTLKNEGFSFNSRDKTWSQTLTGKSKNKIIDKIYDAGRWKPRGGTRGHKEMTAHLSND